MTRTTPTPKVIIMIGGPGAGKSFVIRRDFGDMDVLDSDQFKATHSDYDPKNPAALHAWSIEQLNRAFFAKVGSGESFRTRRHGHED